MNEIKIEIKGEIERFENHLNLPDNNQILMSGIFGIGKTYFINEFFKDNEKYDIVRLTPINYAVSQNEDILEYIKYDIAFEMLGKNIDFEKTDFSQILTSQFFIQDHITDIFTLLLENSDKVGKNVSDILKSLMQLKSKFESYHDEIQVNEEKEIITYLQQIVNKKGLVYEENRITQLISTLVCKVKETEKITVLVIDDLDRIDPEHIFRLFNVFACHFDYQKGGTNKFGFDKIVFVCDIENIRNIFHTKYGMDVDFTGYIDKFYSREIFHFDNRRLIENSISDILSTVTINPKYSHILDFKNVNDNGVLRELTYILVSLVNSSAINLRTLLKLVNKPYEIKVYEIMFENYNTKVANINIDFVLLHEILFKLFGTSKNLEKSLAICERTNVFRYVGDEIWQIGSFLTILDYETHKLRQGNYRYMNTDYDLSVNYEIIYTGQWRDRAFCRVEKITSIIDNSKNLSRIPYFTLLRLTFDKLIQYKRET